MGKSRSSESNISFLTKTLMFAFYNDFVLKKQAEIKLRIYIVASKLFLVPIFFKNLLNTFKELESANNLKKFLKIYR